MISGELKNMKDIRKILAINLKKFRNEKNLSQEKLAFLAGFHRTYISFLECEKRNITIENLAKLAEILGIEPYELLLEGDEYSE